MSSGNMRMQAFVNTLNQGLVTPVWKMDYAVQINNGFPILIWQTGQTATGVVETRRATSLQVYPNPAKESLFIQSSSPVERVEIYNETGVCVLKINNPTEQVNISGLADGFYLALIYTDGTPVAKKIVIAE